MPAFASQQEALAVQLGGVPVHLSTSRCDLPSQTGRRVCPGLQQALLVVITFLTLIARPATTGTSIIAAFFAAAVNGTIAQSEFCAIRIGIILTNAAQSFAAIVAALLVRTIRGTTLFALAPS